MCENDESKDCSLHSSGEVRLANNKVSIFSHLSSSKNGSKSFQVGCHLSKSMPNGETQMGHSLLGMLPCTRARGSRVTLDAYADVNTL